MLVKFDADLKRLESISPMEHAGLLWENLERPQLFALRLHDVQGVECTIDHEEARLETDKFRKREGLGKECHHRDQLEHALGLARFSVDVFDLNRFRLELVQIKWKTGPL